MFQTKKTSSSTAPGSDLSESAQDHQPIQHSIIASDLKIIGNLVCAGDIKIDGHVDGDITSRTVTLGEVAETQGSIVAESVEISGTHRGEVKADSVALLETAQVFGDLIQKSLRVDVGAIIEGAVRRMKEDESARVTPISEVLPAKEAKNSKK